MPTPSKFTADRREAIIAALRFGVSDHTAAMHAGITKATMSRWLIRAEKARPGGDWHQFWLDVCKAKASARLRLAESAYRRAHDDGVLAFKMLARIEEAYMATPPPVRPAAVTGVVVRLELPGEAPPPEPASEVRVLPAP